MKTTTSPRKARTWLKDRRRVFATARLRHDYWTACEIFDVREKGLTVQVKTSDGHWHLQQGLFALELNLIRPRHQE